MICCGLQRREKIVRLDPAQRFAASRRRLCPPRRLRKSAGGRRGPSTRHGRACPRRRDGRPTSSTSRDPTPNWNGPCARRSSATRRRATRPGRRRARCSGPSARARSRRPTPPRRSTATRRATPWSATSSTGRSSRRGAAARTRGRPAPRGSVQKSKFQAPSTPSTRHPTQVDVNAGGRRGSQSEVPPALPRGRDAPRPAASTRQGRRRAARQGVARQWASEGAPRGIAGAGRHRLAGAVHAVLTEADELAGRRARAPAAFRN